MNLQIIKNKYLNSALSLLLFSAFVHALILFFLALSRGDLYTLNYFNIIGLGTLFPHIFKNNFVGNLGSIIFVVIIYFFILKLTSKKESVF